MLGSFSLLLVWTVEFARDLYESTWACADVRLVDL